MPAKGEYRPIQVNADLPLREKIQKLATAEHRFLGPMVLEIVRRYFAAQESKDAAQPQRR
jgi:hypothetical protein